jgi:DinB superfamily
MTHKLRITILLSLTTVAIAFSVPTDAQSREGVMSDLLSDVADLEKKVFDLAKAMPESAYAWRPMPGTRSTIEVFQHIAADNYFMPALMEIPAPKDTAITSDYQTAAAWEKRPMDRAAVLAELEKSFAFLRKSMTDADDAQLAKAYGRRKTSGRTLWISTVTHLHEHLGQLIAYARANKVTPPWSK